MTVSCPELSHPFEQLTCDRSHQHISVYEPLQVYNTWTYLEATRVGNGCEEVMMRNQRGYSLHEPFDVVSYGVFPGADKVAKADPSEQPVAGNDRRAPPKHQSPCPGCRHFRSRDDWEHNRVIGQCCYPFDDPTIWKCPACLAHKSLSTAGHTDVPGECKGAQVASRQSVPRSNKYPRVPRKKADSAVSYTHLTLPTICSV